MFRINALDTPFAYRDLVDVVEAAGDRIDIVMIPGWLARDVQFVDTLLTQIETNIRLTRAIGIEAQIETASGFLYVAEIASASPRRGPDFRRRRLCGVDAHAICRDWRGRRAS